MNSNIGINETGLKKISLEIINYAERVKKGFNEIEDVFDSSLVTFQGTEKIFLKKYFEDIKTNFSTVYKNILTYSTDMNYIILKYRNLDDKSYNIVKKHQNIIEPPKKIIK